jgi:hypothetical protein
LFVAVWIHKVFHRVVKGVQNMALSVPSHRF